MPAPSRSPPARTVAPFATASRTCSATTRAARATSSRRRRRCPAPRGSPWRSARTARRPARRTRRGPAPRRTRARWRCRSARAFCMRVVDGGVRGTLESASASTIIGSLPPSSSEHGIRRWAAPHRDLRAGRGRAGEHDHVDESTSASPVGPAPVATANTPSGSAALRQPLAPAAARSAACARSASGSRRCPPRGRDRVPEGVGQRVVPRADDADDPQRLVAHEQPLAEDTRARSSARGGRRPSAARASPRTRRPPRRT